SRRHKPQRAAGGYLRPAGPERLRQDDIGLTVLGVAGADLRPGAGTGPPAGAGRAPDHRGALPGELPGPEHDRRRDAGAARRDVWAAPAPAADASRRPASAVRPRRATARRYAHALRRAETPPGAGTGTRPFTATALPGRADDRPRPGRPGRPLGAPPPHQPGWNHDRRRHARHAGRGPPQPQSRLHQPGPPDRFRQPGGAETGAQARLRAPGVADTDTGSPR